jgi:general secretion pathway protein E
MSAVADAPAPARAGQIPIMDVSKLSAEKAVTKLIDYAVSLGASDLFFVTNQHSVTAQVRHLGTIRTVGILTPDLGARAISYIKANAGMNLAEKRRPLDGRWIYEQEDGDVTVDLRINMIPTLHGEDMAMRLLVRGNTLFDLENLGFTPEQFAQVSNMLESPSGLVLVTGPTGSGKTATLYAALRRLNNGERKINTIEDPIEYDIEGLRQSQVSPAIGLGWADLLKSVLRQSPDVIMIGEIRDTETAETAVRAANSGHVVFATIHAATAAGAVQSMRALGANPHFLSTALRGVIAQRLVRTLCPKCRMTFDLSDAPHTFDDVRPWLAPGEGNTLYAPRGCEMCNGLGYAGRTAVFEVLTTSRTLRNLISEGTPARQIHEQAMQEKMLDFRQAALLKVARGQTSTEEVFRVIPTEHLLIDE